MKRKLSEARLDSAEALLPATWYAGRTLEFRLEMLVEQWRKLLEVNKELERRLDSAEGRLEETEARAAEGYLLAVSLHRAATFGDSLLKCVNLARLLISNYEEHAKAGQGHSSVGQDSGAVYALPHSLGACMNEAGELCEECRLWVDAENARHNEEDEEPTDLTTSEPTFMEGVARMLDGNNN